MWTNTTDTALVSTHSRLKAAGAAMMVYKTVNSMFQHTAA